MKDELLDVVEPTGAILRQGRNAARKAFRVRAGRAVLLLFQVFSGGVHDPRRNVRSLFSARISECGLSPRLECKLK